MFSVYIYDKTFDGLLTAVFDAYFRKTFPDALLSEGDALPLFCDELHTVVTDEEKAGRVWRGLQITVSLKQPGGVMHATVSYQNGAVTKIEITGSVAIVAEGTAYL